MISQLGEGIEDCIICGDFNINLLKLFDREIISEFFDMFSSHSYFPKITLPTRFSQRSLPSSIMYSVNYLQIILTVLIETFSDHQPYFTCLDQINVKDPPPKYIRIMKRTTDIITNCNEIQNSDLVDKLDSSIDADPNKNYEIVNNIIQSAKEKHMPYVLKKYHKHKHKKIILD